MRPDTGERERGGGRDGERDDRALPGTGGLRATGDLPATGRCRCGETVIAVTAPPFMTSACHCRGCRRMSASAFSLTAMVSAAAFRVVAGEPLRGGAGAASARAPEAAAAAQEGAGPRLDHRFCPSCLTWMFTRIDGMDFVNVRPTLFDPPMWSEPFIEVMTAERLPWATTPARFGFPGFPPAAEYDRLMAAYAAWRAEG